MRIHKLRHQLYIFQIILSFVLFLFLGLTYNTFKNEYQKDINNYIQSEVMIHKKEILSSIENATLKLSKQKEYFKSIHFETLQLLQGNQNLDLEELKREIRSKYLAANIDLELFLIDKNYVIYKTTFEKDLGFNLSIVTEAKNYLDRTTKDGKIYISDSVSTDALDMKYKLYSYSKLKDGFYLELGFVDNTIVNGVESLLNKNSKESNQLTLYNVSKDDKQYYYYSMNQRNSAISKEDYYKSFTKVPLGEVTKDNVINCVKEKKEFYQRFGNIYRVYTKVFDENIFKILGFDNIVMELNIDITDKVNFMQSYTKFFIFTFILILVILILLFIFVQKRFTNPTEIISKSLNDSKKIDDKSIIMLDNELSDIAKKYNKLFDELQEEIELNKNLTLIDPLTEAYNRKAFGIQIDKLFSLYGRYKVPFSVILMDIDDFKQVNDNYGHQMGDKVLKVFVSLVLENIRKADSLYRIGGEEFLIICENTIKSDAYTLAEKLRNKIEHSLNIIEDKTITVSVGVTQVVQSDNRESIYKRVDENMYFSKNSGKNRITSEDEVN